MEPDGAAGAHADRAFAAYGRASAKVQAFEQLMRVALAEHQAGRESRGGKPVGSLKFSKAALDLDFGSLEQRVCNKFKFDAQSRQIMKDARDLRNSMAHDFWIHHLTHIRSERGAAIVVRHAAIMERQIERVTELLILKTGVDAARYIDYLETIARDETKFADHERQLAHVERVFDETEAT